jgi:hypothetical protein
VGSAARCSVRAENHKPYTKVISRQVRKVVSGREFVVDLLTGEFVSLVGTDSHAHHLSTLS